MGDIDDLLNDVEGTEVKLAFGELTQGVLYFVRSLERSSTIYQGRQIEGMKANISLEGMNFFTYLPSNYLKMAPNLIAAINAAGLTENKWTVCYHGSLGKSNVGRLHKPGQGIDQDLLEKIAKLSTAQPNKRAADVDDGATSSKRSK